MVRARPKLEPKVGRSGAQRPAPPRKAGAGGPPRRPGPPARGPLGRACRFLAYWTGVATIWGLVAVVGLVAWYAWDLPEVSRLERMERRPSVTLVAENGSLVATYGDLHAEPVMLAGLPRHLPEAVLAIEDRRFYGHFGVDPLGLARAVWANLAAGRVVQGGSTVTQQLAKNAFLSPERNLKRKVQEVLLAFWLEHQFEKERILELYLNRVYLGAGTYGVAAAARRYFDKPAADLTLAESAMLAGLLRAPSRLAPTVDLPAAQRRAGVVLAAMVDAGFLDAARATAAQAAPARPAPRPFGGGARYFADWVLEQIPDYVGNSGVDVVVRTTLEPAMQTAAERTLADLLERRGAERDVGQAALVAMTPEGAVRAMVGGRDYAESQFNRATQARRQPGSAFKPIVYLAGLQAGLTPDSVFEDKRIVLGKWAPENFEERFRGPIPLSRALAESVNTVAVQVAQHAGFARVAALAHRLGIGGTLAPNPSLALGVAEVTLTELTGAYATVRNRGSTVAPHGILEIRDGAGRELYRRRPGGLGSAADPAQAGALVGMMAGVIADGTGRAARLDRPAAGKTGTSQDYRDAWFVGFTADLVAGVWLGNDDNSPMKKVTGSSLPAEAWRGFMLAAHKGLPARPLPATLPPPPAPPAAEGGVLARLWQQFSLGSSASATPPAEAGREGRGTPVPPARRVDLPERLDP